MFSHSRISAGREFQVDWAATEKARQASLVCMRGTTSIGRAQNPRWCTGLYQLAEIRWSGCGLHLVTQIDQIQYSDGGALTETKSCMLVLMLITGQLTWLRTKAAKPSTTTLAISSWKIYLFTSWMPENILLIFQWMMFNCVYVVMYIDDVVQCSVLVNDDMVMCCGVFLE